MKLKPPQSILIISLLILGAGISFIVFNSTVIAKIEQKQQIANNLPDISGLAWIEENLFLGVHDTKNTDDINQPRVSLLKLPDSKKSLLWQPLTLNWTENLGLSSDLEGAARIPDQPLFIIAESGNDTKTKSLPRLFLLKYEQKNLKIIETIQWPIPVKNIEGIAIAKIEKQLVFIYAERGDNQPNTQIQWATLNLNPLKLGSFQALNYTMPGIVETNTRHISAIDVDSQGKLYIASAFDPNDNNGPFYSGVWQSAKIIEDKDKNIQIILEQQPKRIATIDGFKVEGLAIRELNTGKIEIFIGTDDENYGGVVRPLRPR